VSTNLQRWGCLRHRGLNAVAAPPARETPRLTLQPLRPVACRCIKCKPYSVTEDQDSNITVSPAWMLKKDGTCVKCRGKGAELDCLECNPNKPSMCTKCEVSAPRPKTHAAGADAAPYLVQGPACWPAGWLAAAQHAAKVPTHAAHRWLPACRLFLVCLPLPRMPCMLSAGVAAHPPTRPHAYGRRSGRTGWSGLCT
jgi:hypothetical protein